MLGLEKSCFAANDDTSLLYHLWPRIVDNVYKLTLNTVLFHI
jgi:hypothetical protein